MAIREKNFWNIFIVLIFFQLATLRQATFVKTNHLISCAHPWHKFYPFVKANNLVSTNFRFYTHIYCTLDTISLMLTTIRILWGKNISSIYNMLRNQDPQTGIQNEAQIGWSLFQIHWNTSPRVFYVFYVLKFPKPNPNPNPNLNHDPNPTLTLTLTAQKFEKERETRCFSESKIDNALKLTSGHDMLKTGYSGFARVVW